MSCQAVINAHASTALLWTHTMSGACCNGLAPSCSRQHLSQVRVLQGKHQVQYEDGDLQWENLLTEEWRLQSPPPGQKASEAGAQVELPPKQLSAQAESEPHAAPQEAGGSPVAKSQRGHREAAGLLPQQESRQLEAGSHLLGKWLAGGSVGAEVSKASLQSKLHAHPQRQQAESTRVHRPQPGSKRGPGAGGGDTGQHEQAPRKLARHSVRQGSAEQATAPRRRAEPAQVPAQTSSTQRHARTACLSLKGRARLGRSAIPRGRQRLRPRAARCSSGDRQSAAAAVTAAAAVGVPDPYVFRGTEQQTPEVAADAASAGLPDEQPPPAAVPPAAAPANPLGTQRPPGSRLMLPPAGRAARPNRKRKAVNGDTCALEQQAGSRVPPRQQADGSKPAAGSPAAAALAEPGAHNEGDGVIEASRHPLSDSSQRAPDWAQASADGRQQQPGTAQAGAGPAARQPPPGLCTFSRRHHQPPSAPPLAEARPAGDAASRSQAAGCPSSPAPGARPGRASAASPGQQAVADPSAASRALAAPESRSSPLTIVASGLDKGAMHKLKHLVTSGQLGPARFATEVDDSTSCLVCKASQPYKSTILGGLRILLFSLLLCDGCIGCSSWPAAPLKHSLQRCPDLGFKHGRSAAWMTMFNAWRGRVPASVSSCAFLCQRDGRSQLLTLWGVAGCKCLLEAGLPGPPATVRGGDAFAGGLAGQGQALPEVLPGRPPRQLDCHLALGRTERPRGALAQL